MKQEFIFNPRAKQLVVEASKLIHLFFSIAQYSSGVVIEEHTNAYILYLIYSIYTVELMHLAEVKSHS